MAQQLSAATGANSIADGQSQRHIQGHTESHARSHARCHKSTDLEQLFRQCFYADYRTLLIGGGKEPCYCPATSPNNAHYLNYRADYFASALHEVAHWCIAGVERRQQEDWGYWYCPDGRSAEQQRAFEAVEVKPQALEWMFSVAAGAPFRISSDNLMAGGDSCVDSSNFALAVAAQVQAYRARGLPPRANRFLLELCEFYGVAEPLLAGHYPLHGFSASAL